MRRTQPVTRLKDRRRQKVIDAILTTCFSCAVLVTCFVFVMRLSSFSIHHVRVEGNKVISVDAISQVVMSATARPYFGLIPKTNILFFPRRSVEQTVASSSARIKDIHISVSDGVALVSLSERTMYALWCADEGSTTPCYLIDDKGYIFADAPLIEGGSVMKYFGGVHYESDRIGHYVMGSENAFLDIRFLLNELRALDIDAARIMIDPIDTITVVSRQGTAFIFGRRDNFTEALSRLSVTLSDPSLPVRDLYEKGILESLDVRFAGKAIFKQKNAD